MSRHIRKEKHKYRREYETNGHKVQGIYRITKYVGLTTDLPWHKSRWMMILKVENTKMFYYFKPYLHWWLCRCLQRLICITSFCSKHSLDITPWAFRSILDTDLQCMLIYCKHSLDINLNVVSLILEKTGLYYQFIQCKCSVGINLDVFSLILDTDLH